jgi:serine protease
MSRLLTGSALVVLAGSVFWLAEPAPERHKPAVPAVGPALDGTLVVDLVDGASAADLEAVERATGVDLDWVSPLTVDEALAIGEAGDVDAAVRALRGNPLVEVAEGEVLIGLYGGYPNDPLYDRQWHLRAMGAPAGWDTAGRGKGVIVAVVDTGVARVEDLEGTQILAGASFVPGVKSAVDDQGHGTHVAGTIAQTTNNGKGTAGVAPEATILPVKVLSSFGFGSSAWIAGGIDYAVDQGADVINLSLGGQYSAVIHNAIKKARASGVLVVAAAGNSGKRGVGYPGALAETIGVSATGPDGALAPYSSFGEGVDISAPGGDKRVANGGVLQDTIDGKGGHHYVEYQGTSMATPHVAGAAAVLLSEGLEPDVVERALLDSARGDGAWNERFGHGQLDLGAALARGGAGGFGPIRFALGAMFPLLLAQLAGTRRVFQARSAVTGGLVAGGLFILEWLPLPSLWVVRVLAHPLLDWPSLVLGGHWSAFPLWLSALVPLAVGFTLGAFERSRWLALGLACGVGAHLLHGAATETLVPSVLPSMLHTSWLVLNAMVCGFIGLGLAGAQRLEEAERR